MNGQRLAVVASVLVAFVLGGVLGFFAAAAPPLVGMTLDPEDLVVFSVEPAIAGAAQPGGAGRYSVAVVYEAETGTVTGQLLVYPDRSMFQDLGPLGTATSRADAVANFGTVRWQPEGVSVGDGSQNDVFIARDDMHTHR